MLRLKKRKQHIFKGKLHNTHGVCTVYIPNLLLYLIFYYGSLFYFILICVFFSSSFFSVFMYKNHICSFLTLSQCYNKSGYKISHSRTAVQQNMRIGNGNMKKRLKNNNKTIYVLYTNSYLIVITEHKNRRERKK